MQTDGQTEMQACHWHDLVLKLHVSQNVQPPPAQVHYLVYHIY